MRRAKSIPAEMPADVKIGSTNVNRTSFLIFALGATSRRKSNVRQWVVASRPSSNPARPRRPAPVHTEAVSLVLAAVFAIQFRRLTFLISLRVPHPPGTISKSSSGQLSKVTSGVRRRPPIAKT